MQNKKKGSCMLFCVVHKFQSPRDNMHDDPSMHVCEFGDFWVFLVYFFHNYAHILRVLGNEKDTYNFAS